MRLLDFLVYLDTHQAIQEAIIMACMVATALLVLAPLVNRKASPLLSFVRQPWLFIVLVAISLFACRYPAFFFPHNLNPDEAQMLAQAITYETHPVPWRDIDGGSGGPINSYVLLWCLPLGIQPDYLTGRIFQYFCFLGMFIFLYLAGCRVAGDFAARLTLMPVLLFLCWNVYPDFVHYSSEEVSIFLLSWALYLITKLARTPGTLYYLVQLGLVLGLLPFAKLQSVLLGGFLGLTAIWFIFASCHGNYRNVFPRILVLIAATVAPAVVILSIVAKAGALSDFWQSYICMAQVYGVQSSSWLEKLTRTTDLIAWIFDPDADTAIFMILAAVLTMILGLHLVLGLQKITRTTRNWFIWAILFAFTSMATVLFSGQEFPHYEFFLFPPLIFLMAVNFRVVKLNRPGPVPSNAAVPFLLAAILSCPRITAGVFFPQCRLFTYWNEQTPTMLLLLLLWLIGLCIVLTVGWLLVRMAFNKLRPSFSLPHWQKLIPLACLFPFFIIPAQILSTRPNEFRGNVKMYLAQPLSTMDQAILHARPPGGRIAIWGWAPEFAAETQTPLGTRDAAALGNVLDKSLQDYYRQRYLRDLRTNRPELFLEATGPHNFSFRDPKLYGIATFPELAQFISEQYRLDQEIDGMRLFVRRDLTGN